MKVFFILTAALVTLASSQNLSAQSSKRNVERRDTRNYSQLDRIEYKLDVIDEMIQDGCDQNNNANGLVVLSKVDVEHLKQNLTYVGSYPSTDKLIGAVTRAKTQVVQNCQEVARDGNTDCERLTIEKISFPSEDQISKISTACQTVRYVCAVR